MTVHEEIAALLAPATEATERAIIAVGAAPMDEAVKGGILAALGATTALTNAAFILAGKVEH